MSLCLYVTLSCPLLSLYLYVTSARCVPSQYFHDTLRVSVCMPRCVHHSTCMHPSIVLTWCVHVSLTLRRMYHSSNVSTSHDTQCVCHHAAAMHRSDVLACIHCTYMVCMYLLLSIAVVHTVLVGYMYVLVRLHVLVITSYTLHACSR